MELLNLCTQENANEGKWFQLVLYGQKQEIDIKIYGEDSDVVQDFQRMKLRKMKSALKNGNETIASLDNDTLDEFLDSADDDVVIRIAGLRVHSKNGEKEEPITLNGVELKNDKKSYEILIKSIPAIKEFVLKKSKERTNFLSEKKKN